MTQVALDMETYDLNTMTDFALDFAIRDSENTLRMLRAEKRKRERNRNR